jgi:hypothetical protein
MSRRSIAIWCGVVVILGPVLNFVRDWTKEYPFYDHGPAVAVASAVVLSVVLAGVFLPAEVRMLDRAPSRTRRASVVAVMLFAGCVWGAHAVASMLATWDRLVEHDAVWLAAYPAGSLLAWLAVSAVDRASEPLPT